MTMRLVYANFELTEKSGIIIRIRYWRKSNEKVIFETEKDGFYGTYYVNPKGSDCAVIGLFGDDPNDYMAKCGAKWFS